MKRKARSLSSRWYLALLVLSILHPGESYGDGRRASSLALTVATEIAEGVISPANDWGAAMAKTPELRQPSCQDGKGQALSLFDCLSIGPGEIERLDCPKGAVGPCRVFTARTLLLRNPELLGAVIEGVSHPCKYLSRRGTTDSLEEVNLETALNYIRLYQEAKCDTSPAEFPDMAVLRFENEQGRIEWQFIFHPGVLYKFGGKRASSSMLAQAVDIAADIIGPANDWGWFMERTPEMVQPSCKGNRGQELPLFICLSISDVQFEVDDCPKGKIGQCVVSIANMFLLMDPKALVAAIDAVSHPCKYLPSREDAYELENIHYESIGHYVHLYYEAKCNTSFDEYPDMVVIDFENEQGQIIWQFIKMPKP